MVSSQTNQIRTEVVFLCVNFLLVAPAGDVSFLIISPCQYMYIFK